MKLLECIAKQSHITNRIHGASQNSGYKAKDIAPRGAQPAVRRPRAAQDGRECSPTQNRTFT